MAKLTTKRLEKAQGILDRCAAELKDNQRFDCRQLENELKNLWSLGYQEIKHIMIDLLEHEEFQYLAVYFMENIDRSTGVVSEYHRSLATIYGIKHYGANNREERRKRFWQSFFAGGDPINDRAWIENS